MGMVQIIETKLKAAFNPSVLEVLDESESHRGHSGYREGGESHFKVRITSDAFSGLSRVAQQRAIYKVLDAEMKSQIHALALEVSA